MGADSSFAYAQARMQARFGLRLSSGEWRRLQAIRDPVVVLQSLRESGHANQVRSLTARSSVHEIEGRLREGWLKSVDEVASWQPKTWRRATRWLRWVAYLPALQKLARGGRAPDWMRTDTVLGPIVAQDVQDRPTALAGTSLAPLAAGFTDTPDVAGAWLAHWIRTWPTRRTPARTEGVIDALVDYREALASMPSSESSEPLLDVLEHRLVMIFRRNTMSATGTFAYLGLHGMDSARLQGTLALQAIRKRGEPAP